MATCTTFFHQILLVLKFIACMFAIKTKKVVTFKVELYQHDSYGSPFYDPTLSESEIISRAITRDITKSNVITLNSPISELVSHGVQYFMKIRLGTPPVDIFAAIDTGSDLTWIQCQPSIRSMSQNIPLFNPQASSSYSKIDCRHFKKCPHHPMIECEGDGLCHHDLRYDDGSYSKGHISIEKMRMESTHVDEVVEISTYIFGCSTNTSVKSKFVSAIVGLGRGSLSLVTQLGSHSMGIFSYCLIPLGSPGRRVSHIHFGRRANNSHSLPKTVVVPLVNNHQSIFYFMTLEALTVGGVRIEFTGLSGNVEEGNIVIDSGTSIMSLPNHIYAKLRHVVILHARAPTMSTLGVLDLCFKKDQSLQLPRIVANFRGGDVELQRYNVFASIESVECLLFRASDEAVYGSAAQQNFIIEHDWGRKIVSFQPFDCTKF